MRRVSGEVRPRRRVGAEGSSRRGAEAVTETQRQKPPPADLEWQRRTAAPGLPHVLTTLVPQERELSRIVDRVLHSEAALLTLLGRRGAGKTQPALLAADALVDLFPDGVWFLDLTASLEAGDVLGALAESLGSTDPPGRTARVPGDGGGIAARIDARVDSELAIRASGDTATVGISRSPLSEREVEIVQLVTQGLTDRQVAARLSISHRTVDGHLRRIFCKVGASSRAALAAWAVRRGVA